MEREITYPVIKQNLQRTEEFGFLEDISYIRNHDDMMRHRIQRKNNMMWFLAENSSYPSLRFSLVLKWQDENTVTGLVCNMGALASSFHLGSNTTSDIPEDVLHRKGILAAFPIAIKSISEDDCPAVSAKLDALLGTVTAFCRTGDHAAARDIYRRMLARYMDPISHSNKVSNLVPYFSFPEQASSCVGPLIFINLLVKRYFDNNEHLTTSVIYDVKRSMLSIVDQHTKPLLDDGASNEILRAIDDVYTGINLYFKRTGGITSDVKSWNLSSILTEKDRADTLSVTKEKLENHERINSAPFIIAMRSLRALYNDLFKDNEDAQDVPFRKSLWKESSSALATESTKMELDETKLKSGLPNIGFPITSMNTGLLALIKDRVVQVKPSEPDDNTFVVEVIQDGITSVKYSTKITDRYGLLVFAYFIVAADLQLEDEDMKNKFEDYKEVILKWDALNLMNRSYHVMSNPSAGGPEGLVIPMMAYEIQNKIMSTPEERMTDKQNNIFAFFRGLQSKTDNLSAWMSNVWGPYPTSQEHVEDDLLAEEIVEIKSSLEIPFRTDYVVNRRDQSVIQSSSKLLERLAYPPVQAGGKSTPDLAFFTSATQVAHMLQRMLSFAIVKRTRIKPSKEELLPAVRRESAFCAVIAKYMRVMSYWVHRGKIEPSNFVNYVSLASEYVNQVWLNGIMMSEALTTSTPGLYSHINMLAAIVHEMGSMREEYLRNIATNQFSILLSMMVKNSLNGLTQANVPNIASTNSLMNESSLKKIFLGTGREEGLRKQLESTYPFFTQLSESDIAIFHASDEMSLSSSQIVPKDSIVVKAEKDTNSLAFVFSSSGIIVDAVTHLSGLEWRIALGRRRGEQVDCLAAYDDGVRVEWFRQPNIKEIHLIPLIKSDPDPRESRSQNKTYRSRSSITLVTSSGQGRGEFYTDEITTEGMNFCNLYDVVGIQSDTTEKVLSVDVSETYSHLRGWVLRNESEMKVFETKPLPRRRFLLGWLGSEPERLVIPWNSEQENELNLPPELVALAGYPLKFAKSYNWTYNLANEKLTGDLKSTLKVDLPDHVESNSKHDDHDDPFLVSLSYMHLSIVKKIVPVTTLLALASTATTVMPILRPALNLADREHVIVTVEQSGSKPDAHIYGTDVSITQQQTELVLQSNFILEQVSADREKTTRQITAPPHDALLPPLKNTLNWPGVWVSQNGCEEFVFCSGRSIPTPEEQDRVKLLMPWHVRISDNADAHEKRLNVYSATLDAMGSVIVRDPQGASVLFGLARMFGEAALHHEATTCGGSLLEHDFFPPSLAKTSIMLQAEVEAILNSRRSLHHVMAAFMADEQTAESIKEAARRHFFVPPSLRVRPVHLVQAITGNLTYYKKPTGVLNRETHLFSRDVIAIGKLDEASRTFVVPDDQDTITRLSKMMLAVADPKNFYRQQTTRPLDNWVLQDVELQNRHGEQDDDIVSLEIVFDSWHDTHFPKFNINVEKEVFQRNFKDIVLNFMNTQNEEITDPAHEAFAITKNSPLRKTRNYLIDNVPELERIATRLVSPKKQTKTVKEDLKGIKYVESMRGFFAQKHQLDRTEEMKISAINRTSKVWEQLMGTGKSSVVGPSIVSVLSSSVCPRSAVSVVPDHMIFEAIPLLTTALLRYAPQVTIIANPNATDLCQELDIAHHLPEELSTVFVVKDTEMRFAMLKMDYSLKYLIHNLRKNDRFVMLVDEYDMLINPKTSELNIPDHLMEVPFAELFIKVVQDVLTCILAQQLQTQNRYSNFQLEGQNEEFSRKFSELVDKNQQESRREAAVTQTNVSLQVKKPNVFNRDILFPLLGLCYNEYNGDKYSVIEIDHREAPKKYFINEQSQLRKQYHSFLNERVGRVDTKTAEWMFNTILVEAIIAPLRLVHRIDYGCVSTPGAPYEAIPFKAKEIPMLGSKFSTFEQRVGFTVASRLLGGISERDASSVLNIISKQFLRGGNNIMAKVAVSELFPKVTVNRFSASYSIPRIRNIMVNTVRSNFGALPVINKFLIEHRLRRINKTKQSTSGFAAYVAPVLFRTRIGFTGTPPKFFSEWPVSENGNTITDEYVTVDQTTSPDKTIIDSFHKLTLPPTWFSSKDSTLDSFRDDVARAVVHDHVVALIDTGGFIKDMTNSDLAKWLAKNINDKSKVAGINSKIHCVEYMSPEDETIAVTVEDNPVGADISNYERNNVFMYFDQGHTTGVDRVFHKEGVAIVTVSDISSLRDVYQGAFRMRQLGRDQKVHMVVEKESRVAEVVKNVNSKMHQANFSESVIMALKHVEDLDMVLRKASLEKQACQAGLVEKWYANLENGVNDKLRDVPTHAIEPPVGISVVYRDAKDAYERMSDFGQKFKHLVDDIHHNLTKVYGDKRREKREEIELRRGSATKQQQTDTVQEQQQEQEQEQEEEAQMQQSRVAQAQRVRKRYAQVDHPPHHLPVDMYEPVPTVRWSLENLANLYNDEHFTPSHLNEFGLCEVDALRGMWSTLFSRGQITGTGQIVIDKYALPKGKDESAFQQIHPGALLMLFQKRIFILSPGVARDLLKNDETSTESKYGAFLVDPGSTEVLSVIGCWSSVSPPQNTDLMDLAMTMCSKYPESSYMLYLFGELYSANRKGGDFMNLQSVAPSQRFPEKRWGHAFERLIDATERSESETTKTKTSPVQVMANLAERLLNIGPASELVNQEDVDMLIDFVDIQHVRGSDVLDDTTGTLANFVASSALRMLRKAFSNSEMYSFSGLRGVSEAVCVAHHAQVDSLTIPNVIDAMRSLSRTLHDAPPMVNLVNLSKGADYGSMYRYLSSHVSMYNVAKTYMQIDAKTLKAEIDMWRRHVDIFSTNINEKLLMMVLSKLGILVNQRIVFNAENGLVDVAHGGIVHATREAESKISDDQQKQQLRVKRKDMLRKTIEAANKEKTKEGRDEGQEQKIKEGTGLGTQRLTAVMTDPSSLTHHLPHVSEKTVEQRKPEKTEKGRGGQSDKAPVGYSKQELHEQSQVSKKKTFADYRGLYSDDTDVSEEASSSDKAEDTEKSDQAGSSAKAENTLADRLTEIIRCNETTITQSSDVGSVFITQWQNMAAVPLVIEVHTKAAERLKSVIENEVRKSDDHTKWPVGVWEEVSEGMKSMFLDVVKGVAEFVTVPDGTENVDDMILLSYLYLRMVAWMGTMLENTPELIEQEDDDIDIAHMRYINDKGVVHSYSFVSTMTTAIDEEVSEDTVQIPENIWKSDDLFNMLVQNVKRVWSKVWKKRDRPFVDPDVTKEQAEKQWNSAVAWTTHQVRDRVNSAMKKKMQKLLYEKEQIKKDKVNKAAKSVFDRLAQQDQSVQDALAVLLKPTEISESETTWSSVIKNVMDRAISDEARSSDESQDTSGRNVVEGAGVHGSQTTVTVNTDAGKDLLWSAAPQATTHYQPATKGLEFPQRHLVLGQEVAQVLKQPEQAPTSDGGGERKSGEAKEHELESGKGDGQAKESEEGEEAKEEAKMKVETVKEKADTQVSNVHTQFQNIVQTEEKVKEAYNSFKQSFNRYLLGLSSDEEREKNRKEYEQPIKEMVQKSHSVTLPDKAAELVTSGDITLDQIIASIFSQANLYAMSRIPEAAMFSVIGTEQLMRGAAAHIQYVEKLVKNIQDFNKSLPGGNKTKIKQMIASQTTEFHKMLETNTNNVLRHLTEMLRSEGSDFTVGYEMTIRDPIGGREEGSSAALDVFVDVSDWKNIYQFYRSVVMAIVSQDMISLSKMSKDLDIKQLNPLTLSVTATGQTEKDLKQKFEHVMQQFVQKAFEIRYNSDSLTEDRMQEERKLVQDQLAFIQNTASLLRYSMENVNNALLSLIANVQVDKKVYAEGQINGIREYYKRNWREPTTDWFADITNVVFSFSVPK